jgi:hypothetical protein
MPKFNPAQMVQNPMMQFPQMPMGGMESQYMPPLLSQPGTADTVMGGKNPPRRTPQPTGKNPAQGAQGANQAIGQDPFIAMLMQMIRGGFINGANTPGQMPSQPNIGIQNPFNFNQMR